MITVPTFAQQDQKWSQDVMQPSKWTMGRKGCFITALTMCLNNYGIEITPRTALAKLIAVNGLNSDGQLTYDGVHRAWPQVHFISREYTRNDPSNNGMEMDELTALKKIDRLIQLGNPVMVAVDNMWNDGIPDHAVTFLKTKKDGDVPIDFLTNDPDGGKQFWFSEKYGAPIDNVYGYVVLIGDPNSYPDNGLRGFGEAMWKAAEMRQYARNLVRKYPNDTDAKRMGTYANEMIDTMLIV